MIDGRHRLREFRGWIHDESPIRYGLHLNRLLKEAPKQEAPELRFAPVETQGELVEVRLKMVGLHGPLMGSEQPPFEEAGDTVNPRQGHMGRVAGADHHMGLVEVVVSKRLRVRGQAIGDNDGPKAHIVEQERAQCRRSGIGNNAQAAPTETLGTEQLNGHSHKRLALRAPSPLSSPDATDENLIDLDLSGERITARPHHRRAEAVQHGPGRLVRTKTEEPMQGFGGDAILRGGYVPRGREPHHERDPGAVEDRSEVTDTRRWHDSHQNRPSPMRQCPGVPHRGQTKPWGHRSHSR